MPYERQLSMGARPTPGLKVRTATFNGRGADLPLVALQARQAMADGVTTAHIDGHVGTRRTWW